MLRVKLSVYQHLESIPLLSKASLVGAREGVLERVDDRQPAEASL